MRSSKLSPPASAGGFAGGSSRPGSSGASSYLFINAKRKRQNSPISHFLMPILLRLMKRMKIVKHRKFDHKTHKYTNQPSASTRHQKQYGITNQSSLHTFGEDCKGSNAHPGAAGMSKVLVDGVLVGGDGIS